MSVATTERLARMAVDTGFADLDAATLDKTRTFLLDSLGVAIAGSSGAGVAALIDTVRGWAAGDEATVLGTGERLTAPGAAIVNAYQMHCLEYDCVHEAAIVHPMATVLTALMAHAERRSGAGQPVSGKEFLVSLVVGVEAATLLGVAAEGAVRFFRPATAGGLGAALALARMEGGGLALAMNTIGLAYGQTSGTLQPHAEGSPLLGLQIGFNARGALDALDLALAGFQGPHDVIDGQYGYLPMYESAGYDLGVLDAIANPWQIRRLSHKPFPSGRLTHGVVDALRQVLARPGVTADRIVRIEGRVPPLVHRLVSRPDLPDPTVNHAKLCLAYVAGAWLARERVGLPEFRPEALSDPEIHRHAAKVSVELDDNPDPNAITPQIFVVMFDDGSRETVRLTEVFGHPDAPLSDEENLAKYRLCVENARNDFPAPMADALVDACAHAEDLKDSADLARRAGGALNG